MADITRDDVLKLARLSGLAMDDEELVQFQTELAEIIGYVDKLSELDTEGVSPTYQVTDVTHVSRRDEARIDGVTREQLLANAPDQKDGQIKVPKVL